MLPILSFERSALVTDDAILAASVSALFRRQGRYFPVMDGPRMDRPDAGNEVTRRRNALVMARARHLLLGPMHAAGTAPLSEGWPQATIASDLESFAEALTGYVKRPSEALLWGPTNLGVGLYLARLQNKELRISDEADSPARIVERGTHLLIACEQGDELAQVIASNLAFPWNASFATFPELPKEQTEDWIDELYALGEGGDVAARFGTLATSAREHIALDFSRYRSIFFITNRFPWGMAFAGVPTTHMRRYPDFGRSTIVGLWASQSNHRSARTALLVDPQKVDVSEIPAISETLLENGTLVRHLQGAGATKAMVQMLLDVLPNDVIVLSSHSGDVPGVRVTYEYPDAEGRVRRLVVDHARTFSRALGTDLFEVKEFHRFHSIDGVEWSDRAGKSALPIGSAVRTWLDMGDPLTRQPFVVAHEAVERVKGSMGVALHDGVWLFASHGMHPETAPVVLNNSCWSWHRLCARFMFAGARAYIGALFPVLNIESQDVAKAFLTKFNDGELFRALWLAQKSVYGNEGRRPYVMFGLPIASIRPNRVGSLEFLDGEYRKGIAEWEGRSQRSPHEDVRHNAARFAQFLHEDYALFREKGAQIVRDRIEGKKT